MDLQWCGEACLPLWAVVHPGSWPFSHLSAPVGKHATTQPSTSWEKAELGQFILSMSHLPKVDKYHIRQNVNVPILFTHVWSIWTLGAVPIECYTLSYVFCLSFADDNLCPPCNQVLLPPRHRWDGFSNHLRLIGWNMGSVITNPKLLQFTLCCRRSSTNLRLGVWQTGHHCQLSHPRVLKSA